MKKNFLPFSFPVVGEEEIAEVIKVLRSGWLTTGETTRRFESDFVAFLGGGVEAVSVNSATAGLHLGLEALGVAPGDEVITTTHTFTATAEVIRYLGGHPVFVDIDPATLCINALEVEKAITKKTKAIIPVHFGGLAADMESLISLGRNYEISIMEDAAHALPATYSGQMIGTLDSDVTVFSFYANKTITTGEGGMLVTRNPLIAKRARTMRLHGIDRDAFDRFSSKKAKWYYDVVGPGFKYNLTDVASAIGIHQLKKAYDFQSKREKIAQLYNEVLKDLPLILPPQPLKRDTHSWHLYTIRLKNSSHNRDVVIDKLFDQGIGCSVHYQPLHLLSYWRDAYHLRPEMFPHSQAVYEKTLSLPIYPSMTENDVIRVGETLSKVLL